MLLVKTRSSLLSKTNGDVDNDGDNCTTGVSYMREIYIAPSLLSTLSKIITDDDVLEREEKKQQEHSKKESTIKNKTIKSITYRVVTKININEEDIQKQCTACKQFYTINQNTHYDGEQHGLCSTKCQLNYIMSTLSWLICKKCGKGCTMEEIFENDQFNIGCQMKYSKTGQNSKGCANIRSLIQKIKQNSEILCTICK